MNQEIAHLLGLSVKTVESHRANAMRKMKVNKTAEAARYALRNKRLEP